MSLHVYDSGERAEEITEQTDAAWPKWLHRCEVMGWRVDLPQLRGQLINAIDTAWHQGFKDGNEMSIEEAMAMVGTVHGVEA